MNKLRKAFLLWKDNRTDVVAYALLKMLGFRNILPPYPSSLMIEPTNACNLHCPTCPTGSGKATRPKRMMSLQEFKGIIDQVKGYVNDVILWNYGEPFLNTNLLKMITYAVHHDMRVATSTNGEFFRTRDFCLEVVQSGLQHLIICLDGADQQTINKFRKGSNFNNIVNGIKYIIEAKKKLNLETPVVELQFIVMKHNEHQRNHMKEFTRKLGVDIYREKAVGINGNDPDFQKLAKALLPKNLSLSRFVLKEDWSYELKGRIRNTCSWVYESLVVNSDGMVLPCCYDLYSNYILGNAFEENIKEIWKNTKYKMLRRRIKQDRKSISICSKCPEGRFSIENESVLA